MKWSSPPPGGDMTNDEDPLLVPAQWQITEKPADPRDGLPPAFPAWVGPVQVAAQAGVQLGHRHPVPLSVVAFAQPPVIQHRNRGLAKGDGCCLGRAGQIGAEHSDDPHRCRVVAPARRACSRPNSDSRPGSQPVPSPASLSSVVQWVSKTSSMATSPPYGRVPPGRERYGFAFVGQVTNTPQRRGAGFVGGVSRLECSFEIQSRAWEEVASVCEEESPSSVTEALAAVRAGLAFLNLVRRRDLPGGGAGRLPAGAG